ncbi:N-6 DNA methylase [Methanosphaera sp.]
MTVIIGNDDEFNNSLEQVTKRHERSKVFVDFMDYYINENAYTDEFHGNYSEEELLLFNKAYTSFVQLMNELIREHGWYDYIGEFYEAFILAGAKASEKGQFYTPRAVSDLLSRITGSNSVTLQEEGTAYDCACGSARNLLHYHSVNPSCHLVGDDIDESACKMAVVNFHAHRVVRGQVNWINALTNEYMGISWVVLGDSIHVTNLDEIAVINDLVLACDVLHAEANGNLHVVDNLNEIFEETNIVETESKKSAGTLDDFM